MARFIVEVNFFVEAESDESAEAATREMLSQLVGPEEGTSLIPAWTIAWVDDDAREVTS